MKVFTPLKIGNLNIPHRIIRSATLEFAANNGSPTEEHLKIYKRLIDGGCKTIITGITSVAYNSHFRPSQNAIYNQEQFYNWQKLLKEVKSDDNQVIMQLGHGQKGVGSYRCKPWNPVNMSEEEILEVKDNFIKAAVNAFKVGFDGIQLQLAHDYLLDQFLNPQNTRDDKWGGDFEGRTRLAIETIAGIKKELPNDYPVLVKMMACRIPNSAQVVKETSALIKTLTELGVAAFELSGPTGTPYLERKLPIRAGCYWQNEGEYLKRKNPNSIIGISGGIKRINKIEALLDNGFDFVSFARPFIREPDLVNKFKDGKECSDCISCADCFLKSYNQENPSIRCTKVDSI